jgi:23S rRNA (cytosine1962-C5)-methyltransferase
MDKLLMFENRLKKVFKHRSKLARKQNIFCYRLYDLDMPEFPFCIDMYDNKVYVAEYKRNHLLTEEEHKEWLRNSKFIISLVTQKELSEIYLKERKIIEDRTQQYTKIAEGKQEFIVQENGYNFIINLIDYLDTGLFLDHRETRKMVGEWSKDKAVLNLFAYTASFSVYAAMNEAQRIDTVDLSNTYINWSKKNFEINNIHNANYNFYATDVLQWLPLQEKNQYDIIVCDPPTFSNSKKMDGVLDTQKDHVKIINKCLELLKPGGKIIFSTNYSKFKLNTEDILCQKIKDITRQTTPFDFEGKLDRYCFLIEKDNDGI